MLLGIFDFFFVFNTVTQASFSNSINSGLLAGDRVPFWGPLQRIQKAKLLRIFDLFLFSMRLQKQADHNQKLGRDLKKMLIFA